MMVVIKIGWLRDILWRWSQCVCWWIDVPCGRKGGVKGNLKVSGLSIIYWDGKDSERRRGKGQQLCLGILSWICPSKIQVEMLRMSLTTCHWSSGEESSWRCPLEYLSTVGIHRSKTACHSQKNETFQLLKDKEIEKEPEKEWPGWPEDNWGDTKPRKCFNKMRVKC